MGLSVKGSTVFHLFCQHKHTVCQLDHCQSVICDIVTCRLQTALVSHDDSLQDKTWTIQILSI